MNGSDILLKMELADPRFVPAADMCDALREAGFTVEIRDGLAFHRRPQAAILRGNDECSAGAYMTTPRYLSCTPLGL